MTKAAELAKMGEVITNSQIGGRRNIIFNGKHKKLLYLAITKKRDRKWVFRVRFGGP